MALSENITKMQATQDAVQSPRKDDDLALMSLLRQGEGGSPSTDTRPPIGSEAIDWLDVPSDESWKAQDSDEYSMDDAPPSVPATPPSVPLTPPSVPMTPPSVPPLNVSGVPPTSNIGPKQNLNEVLTTTPPGGDSLAVLGLERLLQNAGISIPAQQGLPLEAAPLGILNALKDPFNAGQEGGLMGLAVRDEEDNWKDIPSNREPNISDEYSDDGFSGQVPGRGHGMEDNVYMPIVDEEERNQIGTLAVSPDEYVVDAHTMSALGNGSADAGAEVMDRVVKNVRQQAFGTREQPRQINGLAALRPMTERV